MTDLEFEKWRITYLEQQKKDRMLLRFDHEKSMQKARLDHETEIYKYKLEIEKLKAESASIAKKSSSKKSDASEQKPSYTEEDYQFNQDTLYGEGKDCHIGRLSKTPAWSASKNLATKLDNLLLTDNRYSKYKNLLDSEDLKKYRTRSLIHALLWAHCISARTARWPEAPDLDLITKIQAEVLATLNKYGGKPIQIVLDFLKEIWATEVSQSVELDTTLVGDYIDKVCEEYLSNKTQYDDVKMENSPFVKAIVEKLTEIDPEFKPQPLIDYLKKVKLRNFIDRKKSRSAAHYLAQCYYRHIIHPFYRDTYDEVSWAKDYSLKLSHQLQQKMMEILLPIEASVEDEYIKYENLRRQRGVIDKEW